MTTRTKLIASILSFIAPMILFIIIISHINFSTYSTEKNLENLSLTSSAISKAVEERMNDYFNLAEYTSKMYSLAPEDRFEDNIEYLLKILDNLATQSKLIDTSFALKDGRTFSNMWQGLVPNFNAKEKEREWFTRILDGEEHVLTTPYTSSTGDVVMSLSVPVIVDEEIVGVTLINLPVGEITNFTNNILDFDNVFLTREDGYLMASKYTELIGTSLWDLVPSLKSINSSSVFGQINFSINNDTYIGYYSTIESLGWKVWTFEKISKIYNASEKNLTFNIILGVVTLFISVVLILFIVRSIIKPLKNTHDVTISILGKVSEIKDTETTHHLERVEIIISELLPHLKSNSHFVSYITNRKQEDIISAAYLHDIGKIGISDSIINKKGKLTEEEFDIMKSHTIIGYNLLLEAQNQISGDSIYSSALEITKHHHERWDGKGYPDNLCGEDIPLSARIMSVVDVFDALISKRPYKNSISYEDSIEIIKKESGYQFDPKIVEIFVKVSKDIYKKVEPLL